MVVVVVRKLEVELGRLVKQLVGRLELELVRMLVGMVLVSYRGKSELCYLIQLVV
jgi:hypothetical protein